MKKKLQIFKGFGMLEYWTHCKKQCFGPTLYWRTRKLCCFWRKDWNNTVRTCVLDRRYAQKCINYVGIEGKQSKNIAKKVWSMFNIFTRTEPKNLRCGRPPTRSGVNTLGFHCIIDLSETPCTLSPRTWLPEAPQPLSLWSLLPPGSLSRPAIRQWWSETAKAPDVGKNLSELRVLFTQQPQIEL